MKKLIPILILSIYLGQCPAQKQDNQWYFGFARAMSFVSGAPEILTGSEMYAVEASASIADQDGNLLFYTDGFNVWNANHQIMSNGADFASSTSPTQIVIIPFPAEPSKYFIFHFTCPDPGICIPPTGLNYSVIDMELNGGLGDVVLNQREIPVIEAELSEKVMAVKHGNGTDWWVITHDMDDTFFIIPVTSEGIGMPILQTIGNSFTNMSGEMEISPNGERLIAVDIQGYINLFDFDRCEGVLSNHQDLSKDFSFPDNSYYGCAFSPNNQVLYIAEYYKKQILQYNLNAADIGASETVIYDSPLSSGIGSMQLGPDRKLYFGLINTGLGVIEDPDVLGTDCNAIQTAYYSSNIAWLPTLPNYNLQAIACETGLLISDYEQAELKVYPNPFNEIATIKWQGFSPQLLEVWNGTGHLVSSIPLADLNGQYQFNRGSLPNGFYHLKLVAATGDLYSTIMVITE